MEDKKIKSRLKIGAYILIVVLSIVFYLLAVHTYNDDENIKSFLLNLSTECFGAFLFFIILQFFLSGDEIEERILDLVSNKSTALDFLTNEHEALTQLFEKIGVSKITTIDFVGYSMAHIFQRYKAELLQMLSDNVRVRILLLNPDSKAGQLMAEKTGTLENVKEPHLRALRYITDINALSPENKIKVKKISWVPSCTVIQVKGKDNMYASLIGINGFVLEEPNYRRLYFVTKRPFKSQEFQFFEGNIDKLWEKVTSLDVVA